jgi:hypothetical protein
MNVSLCRDKDGLDVFGEEPLHFVWEFLLERTHYYTCRLLFLCF